MRCAGTSVEPVRRRRRLLTSNVTPLSSTTCTRMSYLNLRFSDPNRANFSVFAGGLLTTAASGSPTNTNLDSVSVIRNTCSASICTNTDVLIVSSPSVKIFCENSVR